MGIRKKILTHVTWSAFCISGCMGVVLPGAAQQPSSRAENRTSSLDSSGTRSNNVPVSNEEQLPDSPGATLAEAQAPVASQQQQSAPQNGQSSQSTLPQTPTQKPVGTAAAEAPNTSGVAASQPAGVAIAPGKQRRARTIIIRTGAIIGAAVGIGVVVALTAGTSSRPPGAH